MLVRENIQARIRGHVLAAVAACERGVFTCNGNKTEVALNYFTLYGDGAGAAAFLADLWKGQIYELARYINLRAGRELIPQGIIDVVPSAELSSDQNVDLGQGDPIFYPYHDKLLRFWQEGRFDPTDVVGSVLAGTIDRDLGCEPGTYARYFKTPQAFVANLEWSWRSYNREYKRVQLPPTFISSRRAFGFDRREAIIEAYFTNEYHRRMEALLKKVA
jgi:NAD+ synthase (glutamine-hydrolysing)